MLSLRDQPLITVISQHCSHPQTCPCMRGSVLCHAIAVHADGSREEGIVSKAAAQKLHDTTELDYMTHIVLRMYENKKWAPVPMHVPVIIAGEPDFR